MVVEAKGLSLTLHYRTDPGLASQVEALAREVAGASGLVVRVAKMSVELQPPVAADKGKFVRSLAAHLRSVCYLGDDVGDLTAFSALDDLASLGVTAVRVAVRSDGDRRHTAPGRRRYCRLTRGCGRPAADAAFVPLKQSGYV